MLLCIILLAAPALCLADGRRQRDAAIISRVFAQSARLDSIGREGTAMGMYAKYSITVNRRNAILMSVPTMLALARGLEREHIGETYCEITVDGSGRAAIRRLLERTTIPRRRAALPALRHYLVPNIYGERLIDEHTLSPFNLKNRKYYRYKVASDDGATAVLRFKPKIDNTQLVSGSAVVDAVSGRLLTVHLNGEYDMVRFNVTLRMGERGLQTFYPSQCSLVARFSFLGNDIACRFYSEHGQLAALPDTIADIADTTLLGKVRPVPLTPHERGLFSRLYARNDSARAADTVRTERKGAARAFWDYVGKHLVGRTKSKFGSRDQGMVRVNPLLNPLYFGYSKNKGVVYKLDVRAAYTFSSNSELGVRFKAGYSFKQKRMYFRLPVTFSFDRRHNGIVELEVGNGNRISNSQVVEKVKSERADSIDWDNMNLKYFNDFHFRLVAGRDISRHFSVELGLMSHRRTALDKTGFELAGMPSEYTSVAPVAEVKFYPRRIRNAVLTVDYERSVRGLFGANLEYERFEIDWQHIIGLSAMSSLQVRAGTGFYTHKGSDWIFLDYTNFREQNIPDGWYDDWACSFELLNSNWYNASEYYVRGNMTYESPLLILSRLPLAGRFMEKERIYVNTLFVKHLHPYMEYGYGFKTRLFSMGMFVAQRNWSFDGAGVKLGFDLFRDW